MKLNYSKNRDNPTFVSSTDGPLVLRKNMLQQDFTKHLNNNKLQNLWCPNNTAFTSIVEFLSLTIGSNAFLIKLGKMQYMYFKRKVQIEMSLIIDNI